MLHQWLDPIGVDSFLGDYLGKQPYASPSTAADVMPIFTWYTLDRLLADHPTADVLVVASGKLVDGPAPRTLTQTRALMGDGKGLVIRRAEEHDARIADLAASLTQAIPGEAHVQLFVTPGGARGFGWHYDDEDVFIIQTDGSKDYFFRDNTVERDRRPQAAPDFSRISCETSPIGHTRLIAGDWLYLPSRWWHVAKCLEDSLSVSIGIKRVDRP